MKIHERFKKYHQAAEQPFDCNLKNCGTWVSCGPRGCCLKSGYIPCVSCEFWTGYGLSLEEIDMFASRLEKLILKRRINCGKLKQSSIDWKTRARL